MGEERKKERKQCEGKKEREGKISGSAREWYGEITLHCDFFYSRITSIINV
jgi:hypothetical protein